MANKYRNVHQSYYQWRRATVSKLSRAMLQFEENLIHVRVSVKHMHP